MNNSLSEEEARPGRWRKTLSFLLILAILGAGAAAAAYINKTTPVVKKKAPVVQAPMVRTAEARRSFERAVVEAMGTVVPSRETVLKSRVSGQVVRLNGEFTEGGHFAAGEEILLIEPADYQLAVTQKQGAVADARYRLKLEMGHQDVARREWELFDTGEDVGELDRELALREPHLEKAKAEVAAAEAELVRAGLDLERTIVRAPFNATVRSKSVDLGTRVSTQEEMATLVWTDEFRIRVAVPVDRLKWIAIPGVNSEEGARVRILSGGAERTGRVVKLLSDLEEEGRMARLLVSVEDPLDLRMPLGQRNPLLLGQYLRVEVEGRILDNVVPVPRTALREGSRVWVAGEEGKLEIREVAILWRDSETVMVESGIEEGERIVISELPVPVEGMNLRFEERERLTAAAGSAAEKGI